MAAILAWSSELNSFNQRDSPLEKLCNCLNTLSKMQNEKEKRKHTFFFWVRNWSYILQSCLDFLLHPSSFSLLHLNSFSFFCFVFSASRPELCQALNRAGGGYTVLKGNWERLTSLVGKLVSMKYSAHRAHTSLLAHMHPHALTHTHTLSLSPKNYLRAVPSCGFHQPPAKREKKN